MGKGLSSCGQDARYCFSGAFAEGPEPASLSPQKELVLGKCI